MLQCWHWHQLEYPNVPRVSQCQYWYFYYITNAYVKQLIILIVTLTGTSININTNANANININTNTDININGCVGDRFLCFAIQAARHLWCVYLASLFSIADSSESESIYRNRLFCSDVPPRGCWAAVIRSIQRKRNHPEVRCQRYIYFCTWIPIPKGNLGWLSMLLWRTGFHIELLPSTAFSTAWESIKLRFETKGSHSHWQHRVSFLLYFFGNLATAWYPPFLIRTSSSPQGIPSGWATGRFLSGGNVWRWTSRFVSSSSSVSSPSLWILDACKPQISQPLACVGIWKGRLNRQLGGHSSYNNPKKNVNGFVNYHRHPDVWPSGPCCISVAPVFRSDFFFDLRIAQE